MRDVAGKRKTHSQQCLLPSQCVCQGRCALWSNKRNQPDATSSALLQRLDERRCWEKSQCVCRDVAHYGATSVINQTQRPQPCCKGSMRDVAGKRKTHSQQCLLPSQCVCQGRCALWSNKRNQPDATSSALLQRLDERRCWEKKLIPSNVSSRASAFARDVAHFGATSVINPTQRP
jgi:hypothetical protein